MISKRYILPIIVLAQFSCTSLWFAGNGVMKDLTTEFGLNEFALGNLTSAVQFGFIIGTLVFALLTLADRYSPSSLFFISAIVGAVFNTFMVFEVNTLISLMTFRFMTGFFLAGIYPVGMKIAADHFDKGLGKSLGYLVGALVLGTALPHLLKDITSAVSWRAVVYTTSALALFGGAIIYLFVPNGPYQRKSKELDFTTLRSVFKIPQFRAPALGYFGHMWELYTFWAFVPYLLKMYTRGHPFAHFNIPLLAFIIIASGSIACVMGGYISLKIGEKKTAAMALSFSGICCILSPFALQMQEGYLFVCFLVFWGMVVVMDSPMFSTLVAKNAPSHQKGTALTIVNCIGFAITIVSIQITLRLEAILPTQYVFLTLVIGPIVGLSGFLYSSKQNAN